MQTFQAIHKTELLELQSNLDVKIFVHRDPKEAEKAVSQWLQQNPCYLHHIGQSQSERGGSFVFTISLFYSRMCD